MSREPCPLARSEGLIIEELDGELLVYDGESNLAHALAAEAAALWEACDGHTDTRGLASRCHTSQDQVGVTLARLREVRLLEADSDEPEGDTRREALRKITLAGAGLAAVPTISSILVPTPAQAASVVTAHLYWADQGSGTIVEASLDGTNPQTIATGQNAPTGVAVSP